MSFRDNKLSVDASSNLSIQSSNNQCIPPPPPPPSLMINNDNNKVNQINKINEINGMNDLLSPSRHYRIQYSLGIQQDISNACNAMSAPGASSNRKFIFDSDNSSTNSLLKPPIQNTSIQNNGNEYQYNDTRSAPSAPHIVYLSCPKK